MQKQKQKKYFKQQNLFSFLKINKVIISCLLLASIFFATGIYLLNINKNTASAASVAFANGQLTLDKKYYQNSSEVTTLSTIPGGELTVRVKYNNTGDQAATNTLITDTLPAGYTFISGSLKNCYVDAPCADLSDSLVSSNSFSVAPTAGYFGNLTNSNAPKTLEMGKKHYLQLVECVESSITGKYNTFNTDSLNSTANSSVTNLSTITPNCTTNQTIQSSNVKTLDLLANRYLHLVECNETVASGDINSFNIDSLGRTSNTTINNTLSIVPNCISSFTINSANIRTLDLLGNRYLHLVECYEDTVAGDLNTFNIDSALHTANTSASNTSTITPSCSSSNNITQSNLKTFNMLDTARGYGYLQYKMTVPSNALGLYGTNVTMSGDFGTLTQAATQTIDVINCNTKNPSNWLINLTLTDAELRSDQDFTCNFNPKICPHVFLDLDADGVQDNTEANVSGQTIDLYREDGVTLVTSLVTDGAGLVCFDQLAGGGAVYKVTNPSPLTPYNTTGGETQTLVLASNNSSTITRFGYSNGSLSLTVPPSVTFPTQTTSSSEQTTCTDINPIQVVDTRFAQPGWSVTAVVDNFTVTNGPQTLLVADRFESTPGSITVVLGQSGPQPGATKTVSAPNDPFTVIEAGSGFGRGTYTINEGICQRLDPYTIKGDYQTIITYTII